MSIVDDISMMFAIHADENGLTLMQGRRLAEHIAEGVSFAADDRASLPGVINDDDEEE